MERSVRLGRCLTLIHSEKIEQAASRYEKDGTGRGSSTLFLFIARSNGERNSCLLRCLTEHLLFFFYAGAVYIRTVTPSGTVHVSLNQKGFFLFRSCCE